MCSRSPTHGQLSSAKSKAHLRSKFASVFGREAENRASGLVAAISIGWLDCVSGRRKPVIGPRSVFGQEYLFFRGCG